MLKAIVNGAEKDIVRIPMIGDGPATVTGTNSVTFETDATSVIDYTIKGNLQQSGTPSPASPIYPSETGDRTENLFDYTSAVLGKYIGPSGDEQTSSSELPSNKKLNHSDFIPIIGGASYTIYCDNIANTTCAFCWYDESKALISRNVYDINQGSYTKTYASPQNAAFLIVNYVTSNQQTVMLNTGSTALPYEPYGKYKLPITCGTTQNIYLQEPIRKIGDYVDTTGLSIGGANRKIKKLVLTGEEVWNVSTDTYQASCNLTGKALSRIVVCSHYKGQVLALNGYAWINAALTNLFIMDTVNCIDANTFKTYLRQQYSSGTPVTIWYVLAEPETETATIPTIQTAKGQNTLSIGTTLSPSSTEVTYLGVKNTYKEGWEIRDQQDRLIWGYNSTISGTSPLSFKGGGTALTDIIIGGNMVQSGTPSPQSPIYPSETGDRTENLFDGTFVTGYTLGFDGYPIAYTDQVRAATLNPIMYKNVTSAVLSYTYMSSKLTLYSVFNGTTLIRRVANVANGAVLDLSGGDRVYFSLYDNIDISKVSNIMLNSGSTALPYEPYGKYKLSITCGNSTSNIYLQEPIRKIGDYVDAAGLSIGGANRKIKKLVLTGEEDGWLDSPSWDYTGTKVYYMQVTGAYMENASYTFCVCSHFQSVSRNTLREKNNKACAMTGGGNNVSVAFRVDSSLNDVTAWKTYLQQQYSAGTPVTVWYVLASEEHETATIPEIETTKGSNTLSIGTSLQPSSVSITGHIKANS